MTNKEMIEKLQEDGRRSYDRLQRNLTLYVGMSDEDIKTNPDPMAAMFGGQPTDPEEIRESARRTQDKLDRQGREAFAAEYAENQIKNFAN